MIATKTYRLPEALGGGEFEEHPRGTPTAAEAPSGTVAFLINGCLVCVAAGLLTEVAPPLPEEPEIGRVVLDVHGWAWQHIGSGRGDWCCTADDMGADWEELNREHGPLTQLAPDPFAQSVEFPWEHVVNPNSSIGVNYDRREGAVYDLNRATGSYATQVILSPEEARAKAVALWVAADKAEREAT